MHETHHFRCSSYTAIFPTRGAENPLDKLMYSGAQWEYATFIVVSNSKANTTTLLVDVSQGRGILAQGKGTEKLPSQVSAQMDLKQKWNGWITKISVFEPEAKMQRSFCFGKSPVLSKMDVCNLLGRRGYELTNFQIQDGSGFETHHYYFKRKRLEPVPEKKPSKD